MTDANATNNVTNDDQRWTVLSIRCSSNVVTANAIEEILGEEPSDKAQAGDLISPRSVQAGKHESSMCIFDSPLSRGVDTQLHCVWATTFLDRHEAAIAEMSAACRVDVFMSFASTSGQGGFALPASLLSTLARVGANLYVSLFTPEGASSGAP